MVEGSIRNSDWEDDEQLKLDLQRCVMKNLRRREILDFDRRNFLKYAWSLGTLSRGQAVFGKTLISKNKAAVREEIEGPGQLLGYRAMHKKLREQHGLAVPCDLVHDAMGLVGPEGLERRSNCDANKKKRRRGATGTFTSLVRLFELSELSKFTQSLCILRLLHSNSLR